MITNEDLMFGHDPTERIVSCEVDIKNNEVILFKEINGKVEEERYPMEYYIFSSIDFKSMNELEGDLHYKYVYKTDNFEEFKEKKSKTFRYDKEDFWYPYNLKEMAMLKDGFTYFKGIEPNEVSLCSFDIETNGLRFDKDSEVYCITNTFRINGKIIKNLFTLPEEL